MVLLHVLCYGVQFSVQFQIYIHNTPSPSVVLSNWLYVVSLGLYHTPFTIAVSSLSSCVTLSLSTSSSCCWAQQLFWHITAVGIMHISGHSCTNCAFDSSPFFAANTSTINRPTASAYLLVPMFHFNFCVCFLYWHACFQLLINSVLAWQSLQSLCL